MAQFQDLTYATSYITYDSNEEYDVAIAYDGSTIAPRVQDLTVNSATSFEDLTELTE